MGRWIVVSLVFAAGVSIGYLLGSHSARDVEAVPDPSPLRTVAVPAAARDAPAAPAAPTAAVTAVKKPAESPDVSRQSEPSSASTIAPPESDGFYQSVDAGPFTKELLASEARAKVPGAPAEDPLLTQHRALEHEVRDESWAAPLEADIQNSLYADSAVGNFKPEHVECRASLCEIRLSAESANAGAAMSKWSEGIHAEPWGARLFPSVSSMVNDGKRFDQILILTRPPTPKRN